MQRATEAIATTVLADLDRENEEGKKQDTIVGDSEHDESFLSADESPLPCL